jgi:hypothetical protein
VPIDRDEAVLAALALEGLAFGPVAGRDDYVTALYPYDSRGSALSQARGQSSCGLTCEAILRAVGVDEPNQPYERSWHAPIQRLPAVVWQRERAKRCGAWVDATRWDASRSLPIIGDMVEIDGPSHVLTIIDGERFECVSIDGGQPDDHNLDDKKRPRPTAIKRRTRTFVESGDKLLLGSRVVVGWIDLDLMRLGIGATA